MYDNVCNIYIYIYIYDKFIEFFDRKCMEVYHCVGQVDPNEGLHDWGLAGHLSPTSCEVL